MKTSVLVIGSVCVLLGWCPAALRAQAPPEVQAFRQQVGDHAVLFRGRQAERYDFLANGHPYWSSPDFRTGSILFEGNRYEGVALNIDALAQRALVQQSGSSIAVALAPADVASVELEDRRFVGVPARDLPLPEGFYEVFGSGPEHVYKQVVKHLSTSTGNANGDGIGYYDERYRTDVPTYFRYTAAYYFSDADGHISRIRSRADLLSKFPQRRKELRKALRGAADDRSRDGFDAWCREVLKLTAR